MKLKNILHELIKDKDGNFSLREAITLLYVLISVVSWIGQQFFNIYIPEYMYYSFMTIIGAGTFGYSLEKKSKTQ